MKKIFLLFIILFSLLFSFANINISVPGVDSDDVWWDYDSTISEDESYWIEMIDIVNFYLWFFVWVVAMWVVVYWGYMLISSKGSEEELKKANKLLTYWLIWILIALSSFVIVRLVVNLF